VTGIQAGIADTFMSFDDVLARIDEANAPPKVRGRFKKRGVDGKVFV
jgi:hypothetical protein